MTNDEVIRTLENLAKRAENTRASAGELQFDIMEAHGKLLDPSNRDYRTQPSYIINLVEAANELGDLYSPLVAVRKNLTNAVRNAAEIEKRRER